MASTAARSSATVPEEKSMGGVYGCVATGRGGAHRLEVTQVASNHLDPGRELRRRDVRPRQAGYGMSGRAQFLRHHRAYVARCSG